MEITVTIRTESNGQAVEKTAAAVFGEGFDAQIAFRNVVRELLQALTETPAE